MAKSKGNPRQPSAADRAWAALETALNRAFTADTADAGDIEARFSATLPPSPQTLVTAILDRDTTKKKAYRAKVILQLAFGITAGSPIDLTQRQDGARTVAGKCGDLLKARHVETPDNVDQNRGGAAALGHHLEYDAFLRWASEGTRTKAELQAALDYVCLRIARTARPVKALPQIEKGKLTFAAVMRLLERMLGVPSGGTYQQFIVAALLTGRVEQDESGQQVRTKSINAADDPSGTAADVQITYRNRVQEAYEVTANDWESKLDEAGAKIRQHDLSRLHIVARVDDVPAMIEKLERQALDISALDLTAFVSVLIAELRREYRASALRRLYELLDRHGADTDLVNGYVDLLAENSLTL